MNGSWYPMTMSWILRTSSPRNPAKIAACMSPGFQSRAIIRICRKPLVSTALSREAGSSKRFSGTSAATIASFRQASAANPASATAMSSVMPTGLIGSAAPSGPARGAPRVAQSLR